MFDDFSHNSKIYGSLKNVRTVLKYSLQGLTIVRGKCWYNSNKVVRFQQMRVSFKSVRRVKKK
jgi:hypothetical protein